MIALIVALGISAASPAAPSCSYDKAAMLALSPDKFDQDLTGGWRRLDNKPGCEEAAADLIAAYRNAHWGTLTPSEAHLSYWHEGQMHALSGQIPKSIPLLLAGVDPDNDNSGFSEYALGTVAFLRGDLQTLKIARGRLKDIPQPSYFSQVQAQAKVNFNMTISWPPQLYVLDGLINCFDKSYKEALSEKCQHKLSAR